MYYMHEAQKLRAELLKSVTLHVRLVRDCILRQLNSRNPSLCMNLMMLIRDRSFRDYSRARTIHLVHKNSIHSNCEDNYGQKGIFLLHSIIGENWLPHVFSNVVFRQIPRIGLSRTLFIQFGTFSLYDQLEREFSSNLVNVVRQRAYSCFTSLPPNQHFNSAFVDR